ncbi:hypothetical protein F5Y15DRAFT_404287 [Xylariaceae sp. FL0016]|nr:hypothetical protein F5Y15DRAFT_404287 [Xylariaceae sp. FL0016]
MDTTGNCGVAASLHPQWLHPTSPSSSPASAHNSTASASQRSLKSVKSVESVSAIGAFPLGSLRINVPGQEEQEDGEEALPTPLTIPDLTMDVLDGSKPEFLRSGDVFILDDLPAHFTIGCDTISFTTAQSFPGFRDIPPGAHLIWVAPSESTSSRCAYWIYTEEKDGSAPGQIYVKQWDRFNEVLNDPASQAEERFQKERLQQIFTSLSPYQFKATTNALQQPTVPSPDHDATPALLDNTTIWFQLTSAINPTLLNRITGLDSGSWPVTSTDFAAGEATMAEEAGLYSKNAPRLRFMFPMDVRLVNPDAAGAERTRQALDPTAWILDKTEPSKSTFKSDDIVGELQFAFLTGIQLGNFSCLEQWWFLATKLIFRSYSLAIEKPLLARDLIQTFHSQLLYNDKYLEGDIIEMMPESARALQKALVTYKARLEEKLLVLGDQCTAEQHAVGMAFKSLEAWLWRLGWDLRGEYVRSGNVMLEDGEVVQAELSDFEDEDERGEYAPVVVEMENGRETGLVSWDG